MSNPKPTFEFTIDRSKWACGRNNDIRGEGSRMLDKNGFRCCLGFLASACGTPDDLLINRANPTSQHEVTANFDYIAEGHFGFTNATSYAMPVNDAGGGPSTEKELKALFAQAGIKVHFKGRYLRNDKH